MNQHEKEVLEKFVLDIDCLDKLSKWKNEVNFFRITGMTNQEIKHSNFLAWLFDSNANHNLGDKVIKTFIQKVIKNNANIPIISSKSIQIAMLNFYNFTIKREWENLDLFFVSQQDRTTITIENKVYSGERFNQTEKYRKKIEEMYCDYTNIFIYLTPYNFEAGDKDNWCVASYQMIREIIEDLLLNSYNISNEVKLLLNNYLSILRRDILMDKELEDICSKIYKEHREALDLIYENKPDNIFIISQYIKDYIKNNPYDDTIGLEINEKDCIKSYVRFTTKFIREIVPFDDKISCGWNNGKGLMYEIELINNWDIICFATISNSEDKNCLKAFKISQDNSKQCNITRKSYDRPNLYARIFRAKPYLLKNDKVKEGLQENQAVLDENLKNLFEKYIPEFEKILKDNWNNAKYN